MRASSTQPAYYRLFYKQLAIAKQLNLDKEASFVYYAGSKPPVKAYAAKTTKYGPFTTIYTNGSMEHTMRRLFNKPAHIF